MSSKNILEHMLHAHNWRLNSFNKGYFIPKIESQTSEEIEYNVQSIYKMHNAKNERTWTQYHKRLQELPRPGRVKELYRRELKRIRDREKIAFLCKYVMNTKNIHIPKD